MFFFQSGEDEEVYWIASPVPVFDGWQRRAHGCFEGPMIPFIPGIGCHGVRPVCALVNPGAQHSELRCGEPFALWRHNRIRVEASD